MSPHSHTAVPGEALTFEQAAAHIRGVCFKLGPPARTGIELEWLVHERGRPDRVAPAERVEAALAALPTTDGRLPGGALLTREPGGQLELSTLAGPGPLACVTSAAADLALVRRALEEQGLCLSGHGVDPYGEPTRVLDHPRYVAMERYLDRIGPWGRIMMRSTAAVQVSLDAGVENDTVDGYRVRWQLAHRLGPVLVAAFANSPLLRGTPTGWRSTRQAAWERLDPSRTRPPRDLPAHADPREAWTRLALDAGLVCLRRDAPADWIAPAGHSFASWLRGDIAERPPTRADLDYHLSTLFPPVRARGWLELRMIDAQPDDGWIVPVLLTSMLMDDPIAATAAWSITEPLCPGSSPFPPSAVWSRAARLGASAPELAEAAVALFDVADSALARADVPAEPRAAVAAFAERYPARGRCPADDLLTEHAAGRRAGLRTEPAR